MHLLYEKMMHLNLHVTSQVRTYFSVPKNNVKSLEVIVFFRIFAAFFNKKKGKRYADKHRRV